MPVLTLHNLQSRSKTKPKKRVGRGNASGKGTYSTRGIKGQNARSGGSKGLFKRSIMKQFIKKTPKLGGFKSLRPKPRPISLATLEKNFNAGDEISISTLAAKLLITSREAKTGIKIVGKTPIGKKLTITALAISKCAAIELKKAGGEIQ